MGQTHSLEDDLINFKMSSKQMARNARKCEQNMNLEKERLKKAMAAGNLEGARIYAQNVIREKNQNLNFLRLGSRIDAVVSRLEVAIRMQQVNRAMEQTVKGMSSAMKSMEVERIAATMEQFEKQFEDMDVKSAYMEGAMDSTTAMTTPPEQVDQLMSMVADEAGLNIKELLESTNSFGKKEEEKVATAPAEDMEARLAALRR